MSVSESKKMSLMNCFPPSRPVRPSPCWPTKWPCTSNTNSRPPRRSCATPGSTAATCSSSKKPPVLPEAAFAVLKARSVLAAPQAETMNARRSTPRRLAFSLADFCASWFARRLVASSGIGMNSPLDVESSLIGRRFPSESELSGMALVLRNGVIIMHHPPYTCRRHRRCGRGDHRRRWRLSPRSAGSVRPASFFAPARQGGDLHRPDCPAGVLHGHAVSARSAAGFGPCAGLGAVGVGSQRLRLGDQRDPGNAARHTLRFHARRRLGDGAVCCGRRSLRHARRAFSRPKKL